MIKKTLLAAAFTSIYASNLLAQESNLAPDTKIEAQKEDNHKPATEKLDKTGFFIGGGIGLGGSDNGKIRLTSKETYSQDSFFEDNTYYRNTFFTTDINIIGGYQKYFGEAQKQGVRGVLQIGFSTKITAAAGYNEDKLYDPNEKLKHSFNGFNIALSTDYLYDFWESGKQILGVSAGLGYKYNGGFVGSFSVGSNNTGYRNWDIKDFLAKYIDYHSIIERIGIHYYYGRHQIELLVSLEPVIAKSKDSLYLDEKDLGTDRLFYTNSFYYNFNLNYTYRF